MSLPGRLLVDLVSVFEMLGEKNWKFQRMNFLSIIQIFLLYRWTNGARSFAEIKFVPKMLRKQFHGEIVFGEIMIAMTSLTNI